MSDFLRIFLTAVDPADAAVLRDLFEEDLMPVYRGFPGCRDVELAISTDHNAGGLVEAAGISRWYSRHDMDTAMASRPAHEAQVRIFELLRQEPVIRVFEVVSAP